MMSYKIIGLAKYKKLPDVISNNMSDDIQQLYNDI